MRFSISVKGINVNNSIINVDIAEVTLESECSPEEYSENIRQAMHTMQELVTSAALTA